jgi:hypothetical protein
MEAALIDWLVCGLLAGLRLEAAQEACCLTRLAYVWPTCGSSPRAGARSIQVRDYLLPAQQKEPSTSLVSARRFASRVRTAVKYSAVAATATTNTMVQVLDQIRPLENGKRRREVVGWPEITRASASLCHAPYQSPVYRSVRTQ